MPMYQITPTFPADFEVHPKKICYRVSSYHNSTVGDSVVPEETDPRKALELKQLNLIEKLKAQTESLNKLLVNLGKNVEKTSAPSQKEKKSAPVTATSAAPTLAEKDVKKDKDAKKEARKAAKAEAMKKVASGEAPVSKGNSAKTEQISGWTVEDDRKTWEDKLSLTVNIPTTLAAYPQEHLGQITLTVSETDKQWVSILAKVGEKRQVAFNGEVSNNVKDVKTTVKVVKGEKPSLVIEKTSVKTLETIWKLLGASLGLFSRKSQQVLPASHQALWLNKAEKIVQGTGDLAFATREASQFLARFDSLSSQWEITVADVIFRSLLNLADSQPNNVEIWAKKIDKLVA